MKPYPQGEDLVAPALRVRMPRAPRVVAPGGTIHVVARCNNREFYFTTPEDFNLLLSRGIQFSPVTGIENSPAVARLVVR
jgi:hypothetical protein